MDGSSPARVCTCRAYEANVHPYSHLNTFAPLGRGPDSTIDQGPDALLHRRGGRAARASGTSQVSDAQKLSHWRSAAPVAGIMCTALISHGPG